jgi:hypothetical protein
VQALADSGLVLAVESSDTEKGSVLVATLTGFHPSNWLELPGASVTPVLVGKIIEQALAAGWQPQTAGKQFRLRIDDLTS